MWACKIFLCRSPGLYPALAKVTQPAPKTFSTLNCLTQQILKKYNPSQCYKLFYKPAKRLDVTVRKVVTVPAAKISVNYQKQVGLWLLLCSGMVYIAVLLGGYTRLTESGLSMVTWRFTFEAFPKTKEEWIAEFDKYKEYPEFKQLKSDLTLEEFKSIWYTEYVHRNWGRFFGFAFFLPAGLFWFRGCFLPSMKRRVGIFGGLIIAQGLLGWYMVKSGLEDRFHKETDIPRVSQYRLAAHLGMALTLYVSLLWTSLDLLLPAEAISVATAGARRIKTLAHTCKGMVFLTALSGAFVAGLDAGLVYNSFPKMGDKWIPDDILALVPVLKNFTENPTTVQFDHRILGMSTFSLIMATWLLSKKQVLPRRVQKLTNLLALFGCFQVLMGVSTLVHHVPVSQAVAHQSGSIVLLTVAVLLSHQLKNLKYLPK